MLNWLRIIFHRYNTDFRKVSKQIFEILFPLLNYFFLASSFFFSLDVLLFPLTSFTGICCAPHIRVTLPQSLFIVGRSKNALSYFGIPLKKGGLRRQSINQAPLEKVRAWRTAFWSSTSPVSATRRGFLASLAPTSGSLNQLLLSQDTPDPTCVPVNAASRSVWRHSWPGLKL